MGAIITKLSPTKTAAQFYAGIENVSGMATAKNALRFVILTAAARKEEVLAAKVGREWILPAQDVDYSRGARGAHEISGIDHVVPLPQLALDILHDCMTRYDQAGRLHIFDGAQGRRVWRQENSIWNA